MKALVRQIWNPRPPLRCRLKVWWQRLWIRRDEFHRTLNADHDALLHMCDCERRRYWADIARRRGIAHERHLNMPNSGGEPRPAEGRSVRPPCSVKEETT